MTVSQCSDFVPWYKEGAYTTHPFHGLPGAVAVPWGPQMLADARVMR